MTDPLARRGQKWEDEEVVQLLNSIRKNKSISEIAIEHQRTVGGIQANICKLAADYWFNDKRSIEEITQLTGLNKEAIEETIKCRESKKRFQTYKSALKRLEKYKASKSQPSQAASSNETEIITLLKDIQTKLSLLIEKFQ
jgi:predicted DNA-binding protein YlxM (UPF0122 family)